MKSIAQYAVIAGPGMHGAQVAPISVHSDFGLAYHEAIRLTRAHRRSMARHGGSSGEFRVVDGEYMVAGHRHPGEVVDRMMTIEVAS